MEKHDGRYYGINLPAGAPATETLSVYKGNRKIYSKPFTIAEVRDILLQLGDLKNGSRVTKAELMANPDFRIMVKDGYLKAFATVSSFEVSCLEVSGPVGKSIVKLNQVNGDSMTESELAMFSDLSPGDKVFIDNIRAVGPAGSVRSLGSMMFIIRE